MLKNLTFGILAAALAIAPGAAFAGQSQSNVQVTEQNGAATNGSTNAQTSTSTNVQQQIQRANQAGNLITVADTTSPFAEVDHLLKLKALCNVQAKAVLQLTVL